MIVRDRHNTDMPLIGTHTVSVVIPTRNRPRALESCLGALGRQTLPAGSFEVIVVDDGSEPPIALDRARWSARFELRLVCQKNTGPAGARNRGVAAARGEYLAFTDDDCVPTPTWLETLVATLGEHPEALVGGSTYNGLKNDLFAETSQRILEMVYGYFNRNPANAMFFASNNIAVRRNMYLESGGFDAEFDSPAAEDREFCDRWRMQKRPLMWEPAARIEHRHAQGLSGFIRLHWRYGQGAYLYQAKRKQRASGTMMEDLGFHRSLPRAVWSAIADLPRGTQLRLLSTLMLWQLANALGFFWAAVRQLISRG
jgi:glycosyltransferase involved in cell wall biosynthesis